MPAPNAVEPAAGAETLGAEPPATLDGLSWRDLKRLSKGDLTGLAAAEDLAPPAGATRKDLFALLAAKKKGGDKGHIHGATLCPLKRDGTCVVRSVSDGIRHMRCTVCGYTFKQPIPKA
jgi:hypothetical protein